jgi:hypothetical protein
MQKQIELSENKIEYTLRPSKRARRIGLTIYGDGSLVVTVPRNANENTIEEFIIKKSRWVINKLKYLKSISGPVFKKSAKKDYYENKERASALAKERIKYFNEAYGFKFNRITIKNQKTLWGSCSKKGNLNFNYKIALLPQRLSDYIIVHELCHLKELNHSQKFWNLVAQTIPNYIELRKELKRSGLRFY